MAKVDFQSVNDYIAAQPPAARAVLKRVRATLRKALPGATEGISYQIPIYRLDGVMVLFFAGFKSHYSIYPATPHVVGTLKTELAGLLHAKGTIRFALADPVPTDLITRIAKLRAAEATERKATKVKKTKKTTAKKAAPKKSKRKARSA
jgi:uncharacterized protein YdhG (YjbR/CyaY superfamily)